MSPSGVLRYGRNRRFLPLGVASGGGGNGGGGDLSAFAMRGDESFSTTNLTPDGQTWHSRLWNAINNPSASPNTNSQSGDGRLYRYARPVNQVVTSLLFGLRATGDLAFLDQIDVWMENAKGALRTDWVDDQGNSITPDDGTAVSDLDGQGLKRWLWLNTTSYYNYGQDNHSMDSILTHSMVAAVAWAYENNRDLTSPGGINYGARADYWLDYLQNQYEQIWRQRIAWYEENPSDPSRDNVNTWQGYRWDGGATSPCMIRRDISHPNMGAVRYAWYMFKLTGSTQYTDEIGTLIGRREQEILVVNDATLTGGTDAWIMAHTLVRSRGTSSFTTGQGTVYMGIEMLQTAEMTLEEAHSHFTTRNANQHFANSLSYLTDDGDPGSTGTRFASHLQGDANRSGNWLNDGTAGTIDWYGDYTWRSRESDTRWAERCTGLAEIWDSSGRVAIINSEVYDSVEGAGQETPQRVHIPAIKLFAAESGVLTV